MLSYLKLHGQKLPNGAKIVGLPDIEKLITKNHGTIFCKYYFIKKSGMLPKKIRFTSKSSSFGELYSLDICDKRMLPAYGVKFKSNPPIEKILQFLDKISQIKDISNFKIDRKSLNAKESFNLVSEKIRILTEAIDSEFIGAIAPSILTAIVTFGFLFYYWYKSYINWSIEKESSGTLEEEINKELFENQKENDPAFVVYSDVVRYLNRIIKGDTKALILCGPPGTSKTYIVRRTFHFSGLKPRRDYSIHKGSTAGLSDVYQMLWENRDKILILDDFDTPLQDVDMVNMLKSITDTYSRRIISMPREKTISASREGGEIYDAPAKFEFKGKIIIITNLKKNSLDLALRSRAPTIEVEFDTKKAIDTIQKMLTYIDPKVPMKIKEEVLKYLLDLYKKNKNIIVDFRIFKTSVDARIANPEEWKEMVNLLVTGN